MWGPIFFEPWVYLAGYADTAMPCIAHCQVLDDTTHETQCCTTQVICVSAMQAAKEITMPRIAKCQVLHDIT